MRGMIAIIRLIITSWWKSIIQTKYQQLITVINGINHLVTEKETSSLEEKRLLHMWDLYMYRNTVHICCFQNGINNNSLAVEDCPGSGRNMFYCGSAKKKCTQISLYSFGIFYFVLLFLNISKGILWYSTRMNVYFKLITTQLITIETPESQNIDG